MSFNFSKIKVPVLQNRVFESEQLANESGYGYIDIRKNKDSGIFENVLFDSSKLVYDSNYDNEQSNSPAFKKHLNEVISILSPYMVNRRVIEIGCGKGFFLEMLLDEGFDAYGCDPTYTGTNDRVVKKLFSEEINLTGEVIILRHVLEHIQYPIDFLRQIAAVNGNKGLVYIEVPDLTWILNNRAFFDFFYEHVNYFRPIDFKKIFKSIPKSGLLFGEQYQFILADLSTLQLPPYGDNYSIEIEEKILKPAEDLIIALKETSKPIFIWGAASKGVILTLHLQNTGLVIRNLIDINPNKQNKFVALSAVQIISPAKFVEVGSGSLLIIVNPNYEQEIREATKEIKDLTYIVV